MCLFMPNSSLEAVNTMTHCIRTRFIIRHTHTHTQKNRVAIVNFGTTVEPVCANFTGMWTLKSMILLAILY